MFYNIGMIYPSETIRNLMLAAQGLARPHAQPAIKADVLAAIRRMSVLQIDTINVVARSPYLVLFSRLGAYDCAWLEELLAEGSLFEYWAHAACFIPIEQFPLYRRRMLDNGNRWFDSEHWITSHRDLIERVRAHILAGGPVRSSDFEDRRAQRNGWWDWKEEKIALEHLYNVGDLMIARREKFQRIYDLRERVLPGWDDAGVPDAEAVLDAHALDSARALGAAIPAWVPDYLRLPKRGMSERLARLAAAGLLDVIAVEGWDGPVYVHPLNRELLAQAANETPTYTALLSPFDPLVWDRARARQLFNFDYNIEVYVPAAKRKYGYFTLPILWRGALVGRLEPKAHRKEGIFEVRSLHVEPGYSLSGQLEEDIFAAVQRLADWHGTPRVVVR